MYRFFRGVKKLVFSFSYFEASQYFRFRKDDAYVHSSAGLLSLALQIIITISLVYQLVAIFQRGSAVVTTFVSYNYPPSSTTITQSNFMAAIQTVSAISGLTVNFYQNDWSSGTNTKRLLGAAEPCTIGHWTSTGITLTSQDFSNNKMGSWYCMPKDASANLQGSKSSSSSFSYLSIEVSCPGCTLSSPIQAIVRYKNALLNPTDGQAYLKHYIHSDNTLSIVNSASYDVLSISMQDYTITSDTTVCAWYTYITEQGLIGAETKIEKATATSNSYFSQIVFKKAAKSTSYTRNIPKILDAFYFIIGSFAPTVLAFAFFIYPILSSIFEMRFAKYVYRLEEGKSFGFLSYFKQNFYSLFRNICSLKSQRWRRWQKTLEVRQILSKVMQIQYLYQRIDFLQRSMKFLFKDHHLCGLHLMKKDSILDADVKYKTYQIRKAIKNYVITGQMKQIQQIKKSSKSIAIPKTQKQIQEDRFPVAERMQSQMINPLKFNFQYAPKKSTTKFQGTKQFEINQLDYEGEKMCKQIQQNPQYYTKLVEDFKKLKKQAHSYESQDIVSKLIYDGLKQNDIDLMQQFQRRIKANKLANERKNKDKIDLPEIPKRPVIPKISGKSEKHKKYIDEEENISPMRSQSMLHSDVRIFYDNVDNVDNKNL